MLIILVLAELLLLTSFRATLFSPVINGAVIFIVSAVTGIITFKASFHKYEIQLPRWNILQTKYPLYISLLLAGINIIIWVKYLHNHPVNVKESDVIPAIEQMVKHYRQGLSPSTLVTEWGYDIRPSYLPFTWMPFILTEWLRLDYRYLCLLVWFLLNWWFIFRIAGKKNETFSATVTFIFLQLFFGLFINYGDLAFARTVELLICCYYAFMLLSFQKANSYAVAFFVTACLLSRFSLVLWLPFIFLAVICYSGFLKASGIAVLVMAAVMLIFVIPFFLRDTNFFTRMFQTYDVASLGEWNGQAWQLPGSKPFQLFRGTGLAAFFYNYLPGSTMEKLKIVQRLQLIIPLLASVVLMCWFWFGARKKNFSLALLATGSLKIYLSFFYAFIQVPYVYLFMMPALVSIICIYYYAAGNKQLT